MLTVSIEDKVPKALGFSPVAWAILSYGPLSITLGIGIGETEPPKADTLTTTISVRNKALVSDRESHVSCQSMKLSACRLLVMVKPMDQFSIRGK